MQVGKMQLLEERLKSFADVDRSESQEFKISVSLENASDRPWPFELGYSITMNNAADAEACIFEGSGKYAVGFTGDQSEAESLSPAEVHELVWPYLRGDLARMIERSGMPSSSIPFSLADLESHDDTDVDTEKL